MRCIMQRPGKMVPRIKGKPRWCTKWVPLRALSFTTPERTIGNRGGQLGKIRMGISNQLHILQSVSNGLPTQAHLSHLVEGSYIFIVVQWAIWSSVSSGKGCWVHTSGSLSLFSCLEPTISTSHHLPSLVKYNQRENPDLEFRGFLSKLLLSDKRQVP